VTTPTKSAPWNTARIFSRALSKKSSVAADCVTNSSGIQFLQPRGSKRCTGVRAPGDASEDDISLLRVAEPAAARNRQDDRGRVAETARVDGTPLWAAIDKFVSGASAVEPSHRCERSGKSSPSCRCSRRERTSGVLANSVRGIRLHRHAEGPQHREDVARMENLEN